VPAQADAAFNFVRGIQLASVRKIMAGASESKEGFQELPDPLTEWSDLFLLNLSKCIPSGDALTRAERGARELFESFKLTGPDVLRALRFAKLPDDT